jgi:YidC/Oxa1 family membrane protein insertase
MNLESFTKISTIFVLSVPVLTFLAYFFSMKISRKLMYQPVTDGQQAGCSNKMMDIMMPLFSVFISFGVPAALGVYWIFKSLLGVVKQVILDYTMPLPKFTEEDYKAAEKEVGARAEKNTRVQKSGKVVRSLHHIDDEDFEDTAEAARRRREALEAQEAAQKEKAQAEASKKKGVISAAPIKEEKREKTEEADSSEADDK